MSISAFILIDVTGDHTKSAFKTMTRIEGVKSVYAVTGSHDIIAYIEAGSVEELSGMVISKIRGVDGVTKTVTSIVLNLNANQPGSSGA